MTMLRKPLTGLAIVLVCGGAGLTAGCRRGGGPTAEPAHALYHCPMHPQYTSDKPGDCPICGMRLTLIEPSSPPPGAGAAATAAAGTPGPAAAAGGGRADGEPVAGRITVTLAADRRAAIGLRTARVERGSMSRAIRAAGRVAVDERRMHHVHTKYEGWIERLAVDFTGTPVRRGQLLFTVYSPEVLAAQQDYLIARQTAQGLALSTLPDVARGGRELLEAARSRLRLLDLDDRQIARLDQTGQAERAVPVLAPMSGIVLEKRAVAGLRVMPGEDLFTIADLSEVWILADLYEHEVPWVKLGDLARFKLSYGPEGERQGKIDYIYPTLDPETRTIRVRVSLDNRDGALKPEMYGEVRVEAQAGDRLRLPETALLHTGTREIAFVDLGDGRIEPREVRSGLRADGQVEVVAGLSEGEAVVVSANFLLDAESQLKAALAAMGGGR